MYSMVFIDVVISLDKGKRLKKPLVPKQTDLPKYWRARGGAAALQPLGYLHPPGPYTYDHRSCPELLEAQALSITNKLKFR